MQALTGIVLLAKIVLCAFIGVRLLRLPTTDRLSGERLLGLYFVISQVLGSVIMIGAYGAWSAMGQVENPGWMIASHAVGQALTGLGAILILFFTTKTFRPDSASARAAAWGISLTLVVSLTARALHEGFEIKVEPGFFHWLGFGCRQAAFAWIALEAVAYWLRMRRRTKLGLAEPLVTNRFALWSIWALSSMASSFSEPLARLIYRLQVGDSIHAATSIQDVAGSIITTTLLVTQVFTGVSAIALFLTFFPTEAYRRLIERRAAQTVS